MKFQNLDSAKKTKERSSYRSDVQPIWGQSTQGGSSRWGKPGIPPQRRGFHRTPGHPGCQDTWDKLNTVIKADNAKPTIKEYNAKPMPTCFKKCM